MTDPFSRTPIGLMCMQITQHLIGHPISAIFRKPVTDDVYLQTIRHPMDLETIRKKLKDGNYTSQKEWISDLNLIFDNAVEFNGVGSAPADMAEYLRRKAEKMIQRISYFNHQNFEERIRSIYREIGLVTSQLTNTTMPVTPRYEVKDLEPILSALKDTSEVERIIKQNGDQRVLKKAKEGLVNLNHLSRKTLDSLWNEFGSKPS
jgi:type IV secretory pathway VirB4 component